MFEWTKFTIFHVIYLISMVVFVCVGFFAGRYFGGTLLTVAGVIIGAVVGHMIGVLPDHLSFASMLREIRESSDERLQEILAMDEWNLYQTMALLQLAARDMDVNGYLPRIYDMLKSDEVITRRYGWDALRIVFPPKMELIKEYNPRSDVLVCKKHIEESKAMETSKDKKSQSKS